MKKINFTILFSFLFISLFGQESVKKYVLIEHFTNSVCGICANANPVMFNMLENYEGDYHHIAYHPPAPYTSCLFYQHNTIENATRGVYYNILGTPSIALQGTLLNGGSQLLPQNTFEAELNQTSNLQVVVEETTGQDRTVNIKVKTFGDVPTQDLRLYVAVVEKEVQYNSPNGETLHHNVFRDMLTDIEGDPMTAASSGEEKSFSFNYSIDNSWVADEVYVVAFVQDPSTVEVLNSGTRFDDNTLAVRPPVFKERLRVFPNPVSELLQIDLKSVANSGNIEIFNSAGALIIQQNFTNPQVEVAINQLPKGLYIIKANLEAGIMSGRFVKQ